MAAFGSSNQAFKIRFELTQNVLYLKRSPYMTFLRGLCEALKIEHEFIQEINFCYVSCGYPEICLQNSV